VVHRVKRLRDGGSARRRPAGVRERAARWRCAADKDDRRLDAARVATGGERPTGLPAASGGADAAALYCGAHHHPPPISPSSPATCISDAPASPLRRPAFSRVRSRCRFDELRICSPSSPPGRSSDASASPPAANLMRSGSAHHVGSRPAHRLLPHVPVSVSIPPRPTGDAFLCRFIPQMEAVVGRLRRSTTKTTPEIQTLQK
jgi:hypothetical protein